MTETKTMMEYALEYVAQGFKVLPIKPIGKIPLTEHGLNDATVTQPGVKEYWNRWPMANIAIVIPEGHFVLDVDAGHGGFENLKIIQEQYGKLPDTMSVITGGGGLHYWFKAQGIRNTTALSGLSGLDIRGIGGYVVAPPSIHPNGNAYLWHCQKPIADAPGWLITLCIKKRQPDLINSDNGQCALIPEGQRNQTLTSEAGSMRRRGMSEDAIGAALLVDNRVRCSPPLSETEVQTIAKSVCRYPAKDYGNKDIYHNCLPTESLNSEHDKNTTEKTNKPLTERIDDWIKQSSGWFSYDDIDKEFGLTTPAQKDNRWHIIKRLKDATVIEQHIKNNKLYRYINTSVRLIDFKGGRRVTPIALKYPFGIEYYFR